MTPRNMVKITEHRYINGNITEKTLIPTRTHKRAHTRESTHTHARTPYAIERLSFSLNVFHSVIKKKASGIVQRLWNVKKKDWVESAKY